MTSRLVPQHLDYLEHGHRLCQFQGYNLVYSSVLQSSRDPQDLPVPLHLQQAADELGYKRGSFPLAEMQADKLITLPVHQFVEDEQIDFMIEKISAFYNSVV